MGERFDVDTDEKRGGSEMTAGGTPDSDTVYGSESECKRQTDLIFFIVINNLCVFIWANMYCSA